jgi:demethylmenaquinone methyltransferase/2-methoxy-6-polyprenyl-1,4-benzoquinol methylase
MKSDFNQKEPSSIRNLFSRIADRYDLANTLLSFGCDSLWRLKVGGMVRRWRPHTILDLATGSGVLAQELKRQSPSARIVAADFCAPMLNVAHRRGIKELVVADGLALPFRDNLFDIVTVAFGLRNMASPEIALSEMRRVLRDNGHLVILEFSLPPWPLRALYRLYLHHVLPGFAGLVTREPDAYRYFGASIETFPKGADMVSLLNRSGFSDCAARPLTMGIVTVYTGRR